MKIKKGLWKILRPKKSKSFLKRKREKDGKPFQVLT